MRLIDAREELATLDDAAIDAATACIVKATLDRDDAEAYAEALRWIVALDAEVSWLVELLVEAEVAANSEPLQRMPCGLRRRP